MIIDLSNEIELCGDTLDQYKQIISDTNVLRLS